MCQLYYNFFLFFVFFFTHKINNDHRKINAGRFTMQQLWTSTTQYSIGFDVMIFYQSILEKKALFLIRIEWMFLIRIEWMLKTLLQLNTSCGIKSEWISWENAEQLILWLYGALFEATITCTNIQKCANNEI